MSRFTHFFRISFCDWKADSANFSAFRMYAHLTQSYHCRSMHFLANVFVNKQNVFVWISKCIHQNCKIYLSILRDVFAWCGSQGGPTWRRPITVGHGFSMPMNLFKKLNVFVFNSIFSLQILNFLKVFVKIVRYICIKGELRKAPPGDVLSLSVTAFPCKTRSLQGISVGNRIRSKI